jgi:hypothetical protein
MLFARVVACDAGDPGLIPGRDIMSRGTLMEDGDDLGLIYGLPNIDKCNNFYHYELCKFN